jgi:hypothetical protein
MNTTAARKEDIQQQIQNLFSDYHPQSRVWIYQSYRDMNDAEEQTITSELKNFCKTWTAHQVALRADALILLHRFIILIVDEAVSGASGCSIDKSVHVIQQIEQHYQMQLLNRLNLILLQVDELHTATFSEVKNKLHQWQDAYLFDNSITSLQQLYTRWLIPVKDSYLVR